MYWSKNIGLIIEKSPNHKTTLLEVCFFGDILEHIQYFVGRNT